MGALLRSLVVPRRSLFLLALGQAGFVLRLSDGAAATIDPYFSDAVETLLGWRRLVPRVLTPGDLPPGLVLFTHEHLDHCDADALAEVAVSPRHDLAGPSSCLALLRDRGYAAERYTSLRPGFALTRGGISVRAVEAAHTPGAVGLVLESAWGVIYHTGDTAVSPALLEQARSIRPDLLLVPINGQYDNPGPEEAAALVLASGCRVAVPMHYDMFAENGGSPADFREACRRSGLGDRVRILAAGEALLLNAV